MTYTGNGSSGATLGHGLGIVPKMIMIKRRDNGVGDTNWRVYHVGLSAGYNVELNSVDAQSNAQAAFTTTAPTTSV